LPRKFKVELSGFRKLRFMERVKIMLGVNLCYNAVIAVDKRTGEVSQFVRVGLTTSCSDTDEVMKKAREDVGLEKPDNDV